MTSVDTILPKKKSYNLTIKVHLQTDVILCDYCNFTTKIAYNLKRHTADHHGVVGQGTGIIGRQLYSCRRCNFYNLQC